MNWRKLVLGMVLASSPAFAQSVEVKKFLNAAVTLFENLEYEKALKQLQKARAKSAGADDEGRIALLEGVVLAEMGKEEQALTAFKSGFGMDVKAKLPVEVSRKVSSLAERARANVLRVLGPQLEQERLDAERKATEAKNKAEEEAARLAESKRREERERQTDFPPPRAGVSTAVASPSTVRSKAWIPGAVGLVAAGVSTYFFVTAGGKATQLGSGMSLSESEAAQLRDSGKTNQTLGWVTAGVAAAGLVTAGAMFLFGGPPAANESPSLAFVPLPGGGLVSLQFSFGGAQ